MRLSPPVLVLGFVTGTPWVGIFHTIPVPAITIPVTGTGTYHTRFCVVSHETHGIIHTCGIKIIKITITNLLYLCLLVSHKTHGIMHTRAIKIIITA